MRPEHPSDPDKILVPLSRVELAISDTGHPEDPLPLVLIPGLPGTTRDWRWLGPALEPGARVIRVDMPGFGDSSWPGDEALTLDDRAEILIELLDALDLDRALLVGHSAGGAAILRVATAAPERVAGLGLVSSVGAREHFDIRRTRMIFDVLNLPACRPLLSVLMRWLYPKFGFSRQLSDRERWRATMDGVVHDFSRIRRDYLNVTCPTLMAWATDDLLIPEPIFTLSSRIAPSGPRLAFTDGGHSIQKAHATELGEALLTFRDTLIDAM